MTGLASKKNVYTNKVLLIILSLLLLFSSSAVLNAQPSNSDKRVNVLIGFKQTPGANEKALVRSHAGKIKHSYKIVPAIAANIPEKAISTLLRNPRITVIEEDKAIYAIDAELDNTWGVKRIGAGTVHDNGNTGTGAKVAIIDSGIDYNHSDLSSNYKGGYDFVNNDSDPMDDNGHGTHVAGTVAALKNGAGVVGAAPEAHLYGLKVLNSSGSGSWSNVIAAIDWAVNNGIEITNNSYGSGSDPGTIVKAVFDNSYNAGILHVAAAGNSGNPKGTGNNVGYPARYASVIAVAATDKSDKRASWSSTGPDVELSAPGVTINSTKRGGGYVEYSGTSMASPHVAGAAALVINTGITDANGNGYINDEIRQVLADTADDLGPAGRDSHYGFGLVNAVAAVAAVTPPSVGSISGTVTDVETLAPIEGATVSDGTRSANTDVSGNYTISDVPEGTYTVTASASNYESASQTDVIVSADETTTADFALVSIKYGAISGTVTDADTSNPIEGATVSDGTRSANTDVSGNYTISDVPEGTYTVTASASGYSSATQSVTVNADSTSTADFSLTPATVANQATVKSIDYSTEGGKSNDRHLNIFINIADDIGNDVAGALVSIDLYRDGSLVGRGTGTTGSNGVVKFSLKNAAFGCYNTIVTNVTATGLTWDGNSPDNQFCK